MHRLAPRVATDHDRGHRQRAQGVFQRRFHRQAAVSGGHQIAHIADVEHVAQAVENQVGQDACIEQLSSIECG